MNQLSKGLPINTVCVSCDCHVNFLFFLFSIFFFFRYAVVLVTAKSTWGGCQCPINYSPKYTTSMTPGIHIGFFLPASHEFNWQDMTSRRFTLFNPRSTLHCAAGALTRRYQFLVEDHTHPLKVCGNHACPLTQSESHIL